MNFDSQFRFDSKELGLLSSVLNEVLNGFQIPEFSRRIGMDRGDVESLFKQFLALGNRDGVTLEAHQARVLRNALSETIKELGLEEFHTRTGYDFAEGNAYLRKLDQLLDARRDPV